jgi:hypothetical protein
MYLANEDGELRTKIAVKLRLSPETAICPGCRNAGGIISFQGDTEPCAVYRCTERQGLAHCCECGDFPCDRLQPYADQAALRQHNLKLFNLCLIKKMGLEAWAAEKAMAVRETYFTGKLRVHGAEKNK